MTKTQDAADRSGAGLQLGLATGAFAVCFAVFGSVAAMMPLLRRELALSPMQVSTALAVPVLLGSVGRIPVGALADRLGGRRVFSAVLAVSALSAAAMGLVASYTALLAFGFLLGIALASFSAGAGFVSKWFSPARQGTALGVYGAGNVGQSIAVFAAPLLAGALGHRWGFWSFAVLAALWLAIFWALARDPSPPAPRPVRELFRPVADPRSLQLSLYYFLTFGGFVAMAIYLPTLLTEVFQLTPSDAGLRTAGFVIVATVARPIGGALADRLGGRKLLLAVFPAVAVFACLLTVPSMIAFTVAALGIAAAIGLGNGAVFKLVPEYFPASVGSVTGLVGAAGGLGGFFPPLVLGAVRETTGSFTLGFLALAGFAGACFAVALTSGVKPRLALSSR